MLEPAVAFSHLMGDEEINACTVSVYGYRFRGGYHVIVSFGDASTKALYDGSPKTLITTEAGII